MTTFDHITAMVPPPQRPFDAGDHERFESVEKMLCTLLPTDFKEITLAYGTGVWQKFWYLLNPNTSNLHLNLIAQSQCLRPNAWSTLDSERLIREQMKTGYPHAIFPEPGGILAWAITDNGGRFYWQTSGQPDQWPTIHYPDRASDFTTYNLTCAELLYGAISGSIPIFDGAFGAGFGFGRPDSFLPKKF